MVNQQVTFIMASFSDILMLTPPQGEGEGVAEIRRTGKKSGNKQVTDFGECHGDESPCLSLKEFREEEIGIGELFFCRSSRGSRP